MSAWPRRVGQLATVLGTAASTVAVLAAAPASAAEAPTWFLSNYFGGNGDIICDYGAPGDVPLAGDWDGNGTDTPGVFRDGRWYLATWCGGTGDKNPIFGSPGDRPVVGDWDGNGTDTPGVVRGNRWYLSNTFSGTVDREFSYGTPGDTPVVGDWNGDGIDTVGVYRSGTWYLTDTFGGTSSGPITFGAVSDAPVVGDWDANGTDTLGVVAEDRWYLSNMFGGSPQPVTYGVAAYQRVAGDWDGNGTDTPGVVGSSSTAPLGAYEEVAVEAEIGETGNRIESVSGTNARASSGVGSFTCNKRTTASSALRAHVPLKIDRSDEKWEVHWVIQVYSMPNARLVAGNQTTQLVTCAVGGARNKTWRRLGGAGVSVSINNVENLRIDQKWGIGVDSGTVNAELGFEVSAAKISTIGASLPVTNGGSFSGGLGAGPCGWVGKNAFNQVNSQWTATIPGFGTSDFKGNVLQGLYEFPSANRSKFNVQAEACTASRY